MTLTSALLSFVLEAAQLLLRDREATPVDVVANTLGASLGALSYFYFASWRLRHGP